MSRVNGEKARANVTRRRRTAQRVKDRAALAQIKSGEKTEQPAPKKAAAKSKSE